MRIKSIVKTLTLTAFMAVAAQSVSAQDLLARQAPIDRKANKVDTVALKNLIDRELAGNPSAQLYTEWNNKYAHKETALPDSFRIDLRDFCMPTSSRVVTSNYGRRWGRMHKGLDIKVYIGDTIRAAFDGKIRITSYEAAGYGNYVVIRHNNGLETIYGHMSKNLVRENQTVKAGDPIGLGGNTGRSTGSHLHFETRLCGVALNPALLFDFRNQDVTADYYMFRRKSYGRRQNLVNAHNNENVNTSSEEVANERNITAQQSSKKQSRENARYHKVKKGETLYSISRAHGLTVQQLCKLNHIGKNKRVRVGQILRFS